MNIYCKSASSADICLSIHSSASSPSVRSSVRSSVSSSVLLFVCPSVCLSVRPSIHLSGHLRLYKSVSFTFEATAQLKYKLKNYNCITHETNTLL